MKKFLLFMILGLFIYSPIFSQIERGTWRMQNPPMQSMTYFLNFKNGNFTSYMSDLSLGQSNKGTGVYKLTGNTLIMVTNNIKYVYILKWYGPNKLSLTTNQGTMIMAQSGSSDDMFVASGGNSSNYSTPNQTVKRELCYTCGGSGRCKICRGVGSDSNPYTGTRSICTACSGTGKCWHCYGGGYQ